MYVLDMKKHSVNYIIWRGEMALPILFFLFVYLLVPLSDVASVAMSRYAHI